MRVSLKSVLAAGLVAGAMAWSASAGQVGLTSTVDQSGFLGLQSAPSYPLTAALTPYNFTGQTTFAGITNIDQITITLTANDGDTGPGDYDFNNLFLGLDGVNTGLALNGLLNGNITTVTLNQVNPAVQAALIAAIQDGQYVGSVIDTSPGNATPPGDIIGFPATITTTLDLLASGPTINNNNVPLPAAVLLAPLGAGLAGIYSRRFRRVK